MIPGSSNPLMMAAAPAGGYQVSRSLRFNSSDSAYLSRTPAVAGNRRTWTWAAWVKRSKFGTFQYIFFNSEAGGDNQTYLDFNNDKIRIFSYTNAYVIELVTSSVYRDPSAWYHITVALDTAQATSANRAKLWVNGQQITTFSTETYPSQNYEGEINKAQAHYIGKSGTYNVGYPDLYLADIHFIDGQALTPSSFTEVSATTGQLIPKTYSGTYGTNGFQLKFADNSSNTAATLGKDTSGNSNNWTPNNLSVTAGAGNDSLVDTPTSFGTDTGVGGSVRGNYCTMNPLDTSLTTLSNGNLDAVSTGGVGGISKGTFALSSGKWYWEVTNNNGNTSIGIALVSVAPTISYLGIGQTWSYYTVNGNIYTNGTSYSYGATYGAGDVIGIALDLDNDTLTFYKNGVSQGVAATGLTGTYTPACGNDQATVSYTFNFGQRPFVYQTPGTNRPAATFLALCDTNLGAPVVAKPNTLMDVLTWTGNGASSRSLTGLNFSPDFAWIKRRNSAAAHTLWDSVRGLGSNKELSSSDTAAEGTTVEAVNYGYVSALDSNGLTVNVGAVNAAYVNANNDTYVGWTWDAGTSTVSNTAGSITSQVRANASAGFSVVTYTGTGANATVGHGLGAASKFFIIKRRNSASSWIAWHSAIGVSDILRLESTNAKQTISGFWQGTNPSSTILYLDADGTVNASGSTYVAYCFAPVVGYSSFGSYLANANSDGPFVYTGFKPRFVLCKLSSAAGADWLIFDTARSPYNVVQANLRPNTSGAEESASARIDILSNGFKVRAGSGVEPNATNGNTYIYAAWAENPFQYARAR